MCIRDRQYRVFNENGDEVYNHQDGTISSETTNKIPVMTDRDVYKRQVIMYEGNPRVITSIGELAFYGNENITSIKMPDTIISIERAAFERCV